MRYGAIALVLAAASASPLLAQQAPPDAGRDPLGIEVDPPKPPPPGEDPRVRRPGYQLREIRQTQKGAYLGVSTSPASPVLRKQLGLHDGMGLVIDFIAPKSPVEQAGLRQYDILQKLEDQLLINPEQLAVLVRSYKPGDELKLTVLRDGKPQSVSAKLAEHELDPVEGMEFPDIVDAPPPPGPPRGFRLPPADARKGPWDGPMVDSKVPPGTTLTWLDGDRIYTIVKHDDHQILTVREKDDLLFEGPIDTSAQRDRLPSDIRDRVEKMTRSGLLGRPADKPAGGAGDPDRPSEKR